MPATAGCMGTPIALLTAMTLSGETNVKALFAKQTGKAGWALLWLLGVPIPVLVILFLLRGCT